MSDNGSLFTFYALTPLHAGAGDSAGAIDLTVQREKHTEYPVVFSSAMKGSLRCFFEWDGPSETDINAIFGTEGNDQRDSASGKVVFTDAKILLFPVRSSEGVFKWITCPFVIERLKRDLQFIGISRNEAAADNIAFRSPAYASRVILEDFPVAVADGSASSSALFAFLKSLTVPHFFPEDIFRQRLIIVADDIFKTLVTTATQVIARNVLDNDTKKSKNLWYEEVVPADAVFYTIMKPAYRGSDDVMLKLCAKIAGRILQIGGNETIGYGFVKMSHNIAQTPNPVGPEKIKSFD
ncbi:MAG: type III-B CRISPR module RAMP protein Cmr4 [Candidatus Brocadia sp.]|uniref:RAMP superfamily protein n=1 Tax=Candidatus Brocadia fulgida TaxID=380242 RepID=A0A0M2UV48_9BACT|nr:MAG: RAMP superfamily protein [Candidatus Brocadia fulgida]UJS21578.1 MAG: type III-B CRISPR module RAMP protein Cmr4 [Candidatus Brocadia sp.]